MNKKAQKSVENILIELTTKGYTVNKGLEEGIIWLFNKENKPKGVKKSNNIYR